HHTLLLYRSVVPGRLPTRFIAIAGGQHFRQALCGRVLLQNEMGACRRVSQAVQEESLSFAEKAGRDGTDAEGLDGSAALSHARGWPLGLSRDHRLQECNRGE